MADNVAVTPGSGATVASDDIGGIQHPRVKIEIGADGSAADVQQPSDTLANAGTLPAGAMVWDAAGGVWKRLSSAANAADGSTATAVARAAPELYNGTNYDRQRNNIGAVALASASRTSTTQSASITNYNHRGISALLNITAAGTGNLYLQINGADAGLGYFICIGTSITTTGQRGLVCYPGVIDADVAMDAKAGVLPRVFSLIVNHSDASSWTYSVTYSLIL